MSLTYSGNDTGDRMLQQGVQLLERFAQDGRVRIRRPRSTQQVQLNRSGQFERPRTKNPTRRFGPPRQRLPANRGDHQPVTGSDSRPHGRADFVRLKDYLAVADGALGNLRASCHVRDGPQDAECLRPIQHRLLRRSARGGAEDANRSGEKAVCDSTRSRFGHGRVACSGTRGELIHCFQ